MMGRLERQTVDTQVNTLQSFIAYSFESIVRYNYSLRILYSPLYCTEASPKQLAGQAPRLGAAPAEEAY